MFHFTETINIFKLLLIQNENFYLFLSFVENNYIIFLFFYFSICARLFFHERLQNY